MFFTLYKCAYDVFIGHCNSQSHISSARLPPPRRTRYTNRPHPRNNGGHESSVYPDGVCIFRLWRHPSRQTVDVGMSAKASVTDIRRQVLGCSVLVLGWSVYVTDILGAVLPWSVFLRRHLGFVFSAISRCQ